jgi:hypothetical protein
MTIEEGERGMMCGMVARGSVGCRFTANEKLGFAGSKSRQQPQVTSTVAGIGSKKLSVTSFRSLLSA